MKRSFVVALMMVGLVAFCAVEAFACKTCGCSKAKAAVKCPISAALAKVSLTAEQKSKVDALLAACKEAVKKASACGCPKKAAALKAEAVKTLKAELYKVLTPEQKKIFDATLAAAKIGTKAKGGCGGKK